jgi:hypothetical protein
MVGLGRFERPTSPLSGVRSNQLSYRPESVSGQPLLEQRPWVLKRAGLSNRGEHFTEALDAFCLRR